MQGQKIIVFAKMQRQKEVVFVKIQGQKVLSGHFFKFQTKIPTNSKMKRSEFFQSILLDNYHEKPTLRPKLSTGAAFPLNPTDIRCLCPTLKL